MQRHSHRGGYSSHQQRFPALLLYVTVQRNILFPGSVSSTLHLHYAVYTSVSKDWRQPGSQGNEMTGQGYIEKKSRL